MKHISILSLLFLLIISSGTSCKKNNPESGLPPATQEGKNTCGFLVNGKVWVASRSGFDELSFYYDPYYMNGEISLSGKKYEHGSNTNFTSFVVAVNNISTRGLYILTCFNNSEFKIQ